MNKISHIICDSLIQAEKTGVVSEHLKMLKVKMKKIIISVFSLLLFSSGNSFVCIVIKQQNVFVCTTVQTTTGELTKLKFMCKPLNGKRIVCESLLFFVNHVNQQQVLYS